ncbi:hypothetical protein BC826DRAFT_1052886 [Russula brevipes]|nr:hypothetical protein BC826DRAFT_1071130 [Russula brevipes]KAI0285158.1 hypothetical protein BC826DRAFT_1052886 [Russula brevipes]
MAPVLVRHSVDERVDKHRQLWTEKRCCGKCPESVSRQLLWRCASVAGTGAQQGGETLKGYVRYASRGC